MRTNRGRFLFMDKIIAVDIDGTLWGRTGLNTALCATLKSAKEQGYQLILWSARGTDYARKFNSEHFDDGFFNVVIGKPAFVADDRGWDWIRHTKPLKMAQIEHPTPHKESFKA
jgi:hydroxymethylpyrimidine pyrophosphatase-like HAD family hydrolase